MTQASQAFSEALRGLQSDASPVDRKAIETVIGLADQIEKARKEIEADGLTFTNDKGGIVEHPAARIERAASAELRGWIKDRPDLFGAQAGGRPKRERFTGLKAVNG